VECAIAQARTIDRQIPMYFQLERTLHFYCTTPLLPFDAAAAAEFERLRQMRIRIGTMHLKIASIAIANNAILVTRNTIDFGKIPGLRIEDWSA
jgi:tRNA(fMet)-specific endonuclease VapC